MMNAIKGKLIKLQLEKFFQTCFGKFLQLSNIISSPYLFHNLIMRILMFVATVVRNSTLKRSSYLCPMSLILWVISRKDQAFRRATHHSFFEFVKNSPNMAMGKHAMTIFYTIVSIFMTVVVNIFSATNVVTMSFIE